VRKQESALLLISQFMLLLSVCVRAELVVMSIHGDGTILGKKAKSHSSFLFLSNECVRRALNLI
jgi:hypothetical protein